MPNLINYKNDNWAISRNSENEVVFHREENVSTSLTNHCKVYKEGFEIFAKYYCLSVMGYFESVQAGLPMKLLNVNRRSTDLGFNVAV